MMTSPRNCVEKTNVNRNNNNGNGNGKKITATNRNVVVVDDGSSRGDVIICDSNSKLKLLIILCLIIMIKNKIRSIVEMNKLIIIILILIIIKIDKTTCLNNELKQQQQQQQEMLFDRLNLEQSIAAVFNKVAYGSTTKRSIPDNVYQITTLSTPLLTTYRYNDNNNDDWMRVDLKQTNNNDYDNANDNDDDGDGDNNANNDNNRNYRIGLEKDHVLPTSQPNADILKNNNNRNYNNPNRYNNDRLRPDFNNEEMVTESEIKSTTNYNLLRNIRPTKSIYSKDLPSYIPPSRAFFTPPLPPDLQNPFADKPTLRGTNSENFASRRPIPPPSLMPNKDRIPFRPDLPSIVVVKQLNNNEKLTSSVAPSTTEKFETKKKTLNTPSLNNNLKLNEFYGGGGLLNETSFEYEKNYAPEPSITRILSGSNGRHDDIHIPDILYRTVVTTSKAAIVRTEENAARELVVVEEQEEKVEPTTTTTTTTMVVAVTSSSATASTTMMTTTTEMSLNLANKKEFSNNVTTKMVSNDEIWLICWNVHIYLAIIAFVLLALYSIYRLIRYEYEPHMFSKSYFLTIHLLLTIICILRIFYLIYDPYNINKSFNVFLYDFLHNFPLNLLTMTFSILILFLLKRTLTHLEVKTRPIVLLVFSILHIFICLSLSIFESCFNYLDKTNLIVCKPIFVLLTWSLGFSYLYLYRIIKNVLDKKSQNLSELCTQNIAYASHITIAIALLFILLGFVQLYSLFFIKIDRFNDEIKHHWILWSFEMSVRLLEITIIVLLIIVVSLKMSQRNIMGGGGGGGGGEKQISNFPLFPCTTTTTSDSSTDNIYPSNCNTNPNALNYSRNEMLMMEEASLQPLPPLNKEERPAKMLLIKKSDMKSSTLERYHNSSDNESQRFEQRPKWMTNSDRFEHYRTHNEFERSSLNHRKPYDSAKYYTTSVVMKKYLNDDENDERNIYSEPLEQYDFDRRSRNSSLSNGGGGGSSSRRSSTIRTTRQKNQTPPRTHHHTQTLPNHDHHYNRQQQQQQQQQQITDTMLVDEQGFVRFRHMQDGLLLDNKSIKKIKKQLQQQQQSYLSDAS